MQTDKFVSGLLSLVLLTGSSSLLAAPPWSFGTAKPEARPTAKSYELTEKQGPWLILTTSFSGPNAEKQALELVSEIRTKYRLNAYLHRLNFDYSKPVQGLGVNMYGEPKKFRHLNGEKFEEIAVMVGDYNSVEDPAAQKALETLKYAKPACLDYEKKNVKEIDQRFAELRRDIMMVHKKFNDVGKKDRGPLGSSFLTRNPLLPEEMFVSKGLDPFVVEMNQDLEFSLLKNPKTYTVRIASFRGVDTMSPKKFDELTTKRKGTAKLDEAADKAHKLTEHLRKQGYEAYEFHDVTESMVCVGAFDSVGTPRADGKTEINPAVLKIMERFGPNKQVAPGQTSAQLQPKIELGMPLDYQPIPVFVPRSSVGSQLTKTARR